MFTSCILVLSQLLNTAYSLYSTEQLQNALNSKCELQTLYEEHKKTHLQRHTRPPHEETRRMELFLQEIKEVLKLRANEDIKWDVGLNFMADMTDEEMDLIRGYSGNETSLQSNLKDVLPPIQSKLSAPSTFSAPPFFDLWRISGGVGPIHDQKKGSCWAHAAVVPLEAQLAYFQGSFQQLSIQELYDCTYPKERSPRGGNVQDAWDYVSLSGRLGTWQESPEIAEAWYSFFYDTRSCDGYNMKTNALDGFYIDKKLWITSERELLKTLVCTTPVPVSLDTSNTGLTRYKGGLFTMPATCRQADHALVIMGYTEEALIIKNSWGDKWGQFGYLRLDRAGPSCGMYGSTFAVYLEKIGEDPKECRWDWEEEMKMK